MIDLPKSFSLEALRGKGKEKKITSLKTYRGWVARKDNIEENEGL